MATATRYSPNINTREDVEARLRWLRRFAQLSDEAIKIPGTNYRLGFDSIVGLIPGIGDFATAAAALYMVHEAKQLGVSKVTLVRMIGNVAVDALIGAVPLLGDFFDVAWKANTRNLRLLEADLGIEPEEQVPPRPTRLLR